eukprot:3170175-Pleurochrysis_carterae.AAC.2
MRSWVEFWSRVLCVPGCCGLCCGDEVASPVASCGRMAGCNSSLSHADTALAETASDRCATLGMKCSTANLT